MSEAKLLPSEGTLAEGQLEVEFALVLARTIEELDQNPDQLRQIVYDLARLKLLEQFTHSDAKTAKHAQKALETAIAGVEQFVQTRPPFRPQLPASHELVSDPSTIEIEGPRAVSQTLMVAPFQTASLRRRALLSKGILKRTGALLLTLIVCALTYTQRQWLMERFLSRAKTEQAYVPAAPIVRPAIPMPDPNSLLPTRFGVYAVSNGSLFDLQLLPGAAPDIRVAISFAITTSSQTIVNEPRPKFILYQRDTPNNLVDRADVRVMAKIAKNFAPTKENRTRDADESWVIRNISIPFRISPVGERAGMYELTIDERAGPDLSPGRYALIVNDRAYDFTIAGDAIDDRHCLERVIATNGVFYTPCKRL